MTDNADEPDPDRAAWETEDTAMATVWRLASKITLTRLVILAALTVPVVVLVPLWGLAGVVATLSLHGWVRSLAVGYLLALLIGCLVSVLHLPAQRAPRLPTVAELTDRTAWLYRVVTAPLISLCVVYLVRAGVPLGWAVGASLLGWAALDLSLLATHPAKVTLYRVLRLSRPRA
jgi:hypothetical protein